MFIVTNNTEENIYLQDLGLSLTASASADLDICYYSYEYLASKDLKEKVTNGDIILNDGENGNLTPEEAEDAVSITNNHSVTQIVTNTIVVSGANYTTNVIQVCSNQIQENIPNSAVNFNQEIIKNDDYTHNNSSNPSRIYVNKNGYYRISYTCSASNNANSRRQIKWYVRKNGSDEINGTQSYSYHRNRTEGSGTGHNSFIIQLSTNDYIEIMAYCNLGFDPRPKGLQQAQVKWNLDTIADSCSCSIELIKTI